MEDNEGEISESSERPQTGMSVFKLSIQEILQSKGSKEAKDDKEPKEDDDEINEEIKEKVNKEEKDGGKDEGDDLRVTLETRKMQDNSDSVFKPFIEEAKLNQSWDNSLIEEINMKDIRDLEVKKMMVRFLIGFFIGLTIALWMFVVFVLLDFQFS
eukprot:TRINITY_DN8240_c0_g1_i1.p1 TRINITY_DN8240_c0_g1~~TRINITY_DN8240_c0_g1_i1.p1  ORF type:complete len:156 (+),score=41.27 TRINITY_DN8240_c0_g1_i1:121-588(+)